MGSCFSRRIKVHVDDSEDHENVFYASYRPTTCAPGLDENDPCVMMELRDINTHKLR